MSVVLVIQNYQELICLTLIYRNKVVRQHTTTELKNKTNEMYLLHPSFSTGNTYELLKRITTK